MAPTRTVLIVDDNEAHNYSVARGLEHCGYRILRASTGTDAIKLTLQHKPDAVLLDIHLPDVNGLEVCKRIRQNPETCKLAIVFYTGIAASAVPDHSQYGADAFLTYPIGEEVLRAVIDGTIARRDMPARGAA